MAKASSNLHTGLPAGLDFFVTISSAIDALAQFRMSRGERTVPLDLGSILDVGYLTNHRKRVDKIAHDKKLVVMLMELGVRAPGRLLRPFRIIPPSYLNHRTDTPYHDNATMGTHAPSA
ncbi:hypothetical protein F4861DRAFT_541863 [Xylaria intraflava]|nr:hypothetical protein F4861DRAFT_541863 [Xylaria intraflava]